MGEYNICFNADNNYTEQIGVTITSILKNADKDEKFNFYVLDGGFTQESKEQIKELTKIKEFKISFVKMNIDDFKNCPLLRDYNKDFEHYHVPTSAYFRYKIASTFPKLDKILYLDCDIVVMGSLKELYEKDISDNYAAMVPDVESESEAERLGLTAYYNAGVMLINLAKWREDNIEEKLFDYTQKNKNKILWQDQDVLNAVLKDKIKILPRKWNFQFFQYDPSRYEGLYEKYYEYTIIHFAGRFKPWTDEIIHPLFNEYYSYLMLTPWKNSLVKYKKQAFDKFFRSDIQGSALYEEIEKIKGYLDEKIDLYDKNLEEKFKQYGISNASSITESLKSFFEEAIKSQLELMKASFENTHRLEKETIENDFKNKIKYQEELFEAKINNQKIWYENELTNQNKRNENEVQRQLNSANSWHLNNLNEKLNEQREFYKKELEAKKEYYQTNLDEGRTKLNESQKELEELKKQLNNANAELEREKTSLSELKNKVENKQNELSQAQGHIYSLQREIEGLKNEVAELKININNLEKAESKEDY